MTYELIPGVVVRGEHEPAGAGDIVITPFELNAYPWNSETTRACLEVAQAEVRPGDSVLDFGCGPVAICGLVAYRVFGAGYVHLVENDPPVRAEAQRQIELNGLFAVVDEDPRPATVYDYVIANVGDADLVKTIAPLGTHGVGTEQDGTLIRW